VGANISLTSLLQNGNHFQNLHRVMRKKRMPEKVSAPRDIINAGKFFSLLQKMPQ
jgi:hypothetical protein